MGNLEKPWVISCLSLPFHSGAPIPELDWHGGREVGNSWPLLSTKVYVPQTELYSWKEGMESSDVSAKHKWKQILKWIIQGKTHQSWQQTTS